MWQFFMLLSALTITLWFSLIYYTKTNFFSATLVHFNVFDKIALNNNDTSSSFVNSERKISRKKIKHHIPKFMLDLYEKSIRNGYNQPDVVRSVIPKNAGFLDSAQPFKDYQDNHLLVFDVPSTDDDEVFVSAELKILTIVEVDITSLPTLERVVKVSIYDDKSQRLFHLDEARVFHTNNTWISFNMTTPISGLLSRNQTDQFLKVVISIRAYLPYASDDASKFKLLSLLPIEEDLEHDYPVLLLTYSSNRRRGNNRKKRNTEDDYEEETNNVWDDDPNKKRKLKRLRHSCRKKPLFVDFAEIQYDMWIVQPSGYEAYQCQGKCFYPVADHLSPTKHAIVQALLHSVSPARASRSCCVPTQLDSISVLYIDNKGVLTYRYAYKDMVVTECGCR